MAEYTPTTDDIRQAWTLCKVPRIGGDYGGPGRGYEFDRWLEAVRREAKAEALEEFAALLRERYPEDVFKPLKDADHKAVNDALAGRIGRTHVTRDAVSADMMRRAAAQADAEASEYRKTPDGTGESNE